MAATMVSNDVEFLNFMELLEIQLTDQNLNSYINKYNEFCNYRLSYTHLGETLERTFIKWKNHQDVLAQPKKLNPSLSAPPNRL